ncbi:MAG: isopentenyl phosphate kinase family protein [Pleurocapsa minor GSE-CHR-MK-17-07R]|jgi:isopentenyl phosphate kinase|nr:isopentenyl phosphate kinase family protein [Pleurocapsa minor GSE-CHR-MK 17-07R]
MLIFIKLGGSLITDKQVASSFRAEVMARLADEIRLAVSADPSLRVVVGHGSGSFGHVAAKKYGTATGVSDSAGWLGFAEVAHAAGELNYRVLNSLRTAGLPAMKFSPSASAIAADIRIQHMAIEPIKRALEHGIVPLVHGDVGFDDIRGGTILSTETVFIHLAAHLPVEQVLLLGEVRGVYDQSGAVISEITPSRLAEVEAALGSSGGVDVTGGMETKVKDMLALVSAQPRLKIRIMDGLQPGLLTRTLLGQSSEGTLIRQD